MFYSVIPSILQCKPRHARLLGWSHSTIVCPLSREKSAHSDIGKQRRRPSRSRGGGRKGRLKWHPQRSSVSILHKGEASERASERRVRSHRSTSESKPTSLNRNYFPLLGSLRHGNMCQRYKHFHTDVLSYSDTFGTGPMCHCRKASL